MSFVDDLGPSLKEAAIEKRSNDDFRGRSIFIRAPFVCDICKVHHGQKWFVVKDSYLVYLNPMSGSIGFPMLVDREFSIDRGFRKTGTNNGIQIRNSQRLMILKFEREEERDQWFDLLGRLKDRSIYALKHRFSSFAPPRKNQWAKWFVFDDTTHLFPSNRRRTNFFPGSSTANRIWNPWPKQFFSPKKRFLSRIGGSHRKSYLFVHQSMGICR